ncbi:hypothetical protein HY448_02320 [Candidatus Pacearchaeota archaeon]|nr:hypothetical protein [Candidatus Pacearchaeota archaeon]
MSDTTDEIESGAGLYENYLEDQRLIKERAREKDILISIIDRRIEIAKDVCICNEGIHDGNRIDCGCFHHK